MFDLFKSFFYKLRKDVTFKVVIILGLIMMIGFPLALLGIELLLAIGSTPYQIGHDVLNGQNMLMNAVQPIMGYALTIPIVLVTFIGLEFSQGCIRNKIISGHSKGRIYFSLFAFGLILTLAIMTIYISGTTLLGSILSLSGFHFDKTIIIFFTFASGKAGVEFIIKYVVLCYLAYCSIVSITVFFSTLVRNIGLTIVIIVVILLGLHFVAVALKYAQAIGANFSESCEYVWDEATQSTTYVCTKVRDNPTDFLYYIGLVIDPAFCITQTLSLDFTSALEIKTLDFVLNILSNVIYIASFFFGGFFIFRKSEVK